MRLRVLDLPGPLPEPPEVAPPTFALVVDEVPTEKLFPEFVEQLQAFAEQVGAAGVLVTEHSVQIAAMTPLIEMQAQPGALQRLGALGAAAFARLPGRRPS